MERTTIHDADLAAAALAGDRDAFAAIYDRYADPVFTLCAHLLSDVDDAADVCGDVFLVAAERLGQLRDPSRLRVWLFAIARRQVYQRTRHRSRTVPVPEIVDMMGPMSDPVGAAAESTDLVDLVRAASAGLDDSDRVVMELSLQGLVGADLAEALGVSANHASQVDHRMRARLERSVGALMVARQGRADCPDLDGVLRDWDGRFSVLWRKRVARHVDGCEVCERRRRLVPMSLFQGAAGASPLALMPVALVAPGAVRGRVLDHAQVGSSAGRRWSRTGFPPSDRRRSRLLLVAAASVVAVLALLGATSVLADGGDDVLAAGTGAGAQLESARRPTSSSAPPPPPTTSAPVGAGDTVSDGRPAATSTVPRPSGPRTTSAPPRPTTAPATTTPTTAPAPSTTVPAAPPTVDSFDAYDGAPCGGSFQEITLKWASTGATAVSISGSVGTLTGLPEDGSTTVCAQPGGSWTLTATGPGGSASRSTP